MAPPGAVVAVELHHLRLPLVRPFRSALGEDHARDVLLVRAVTEAGEGWGECAALGTPAYSSEYVAGARHVLRRHLGPLLLAAGPVTAAAVAGALAGVRGHRMAKAALEMAVLDAELRAAGVSLAHHLGATRDRVEAGVAVGVQGSLPVLVDAVGAALDEGYRRVKLKIAPGWDVEPVGAVRARFGDDVVLQADANGAYRREDAEHLARLDPFALAMVEQPLPPDDLDGHVALARRITTPVCLDESVTSAALAAHAVSLGAAAVVNVKAGRVGGYLEAARVHEVCRAAGVAAWCGGMFETGLARRANLALAALPGFVLPGDVSPPSRYLAVDVVDPLVAEGGVVRVPDAPGLGADLLLDVASEHTVSVDHIDGDHVTG